MLLVEFRIRTVYNNDEWAEDIESGEESVSDGGFFTTSHYLVNKSLKDYEADEQKFEEMVLKQAYSTDNPIKPHYFFPFACDVHISEPDDWDWKSKPDGFLTERENCINCSYPVLLKRSEDSTLEIRVESVESISSGEARVFAKRIYTLDVTGYNNLNKNEVYKKYYNEEIKTN